MENYYPNCLTGDKKGDYENIFDYDNNSVQPLFKPVNEMIKLIEEEINKAQK